MNVKDIGEIAEGLLAEVKKLYEEAQSSKKKAIHDETMYGGAAEGIKLFYKELVKFVNEEVVDESGKDSSSTGRAKKKGKTPIRAVKSGK